MYFEENKEEKQVRFHFDSTKICGFSKSYLIRLPVKRNLFRLLWLAFHTWFIWTAWTWSDLKILITSLKLYPLLTLKSKIQVFEVPYVRVRLYPSLMDMISDWFPIIFKGQFSCTKNFVIKLRFFGLARFPSFHSYFPLPFKKKKNKIFFVIMENHNN